MAFNCGSLSHISKPANGAIAARIIINTVMGGGGASIIILIMCKTGIVGVSTWAFTTTLNATIAGMVSIVWNPEFALSKKFAILVSDSHSHIKSVRLITISFIFAI